MKKQILILVGIIIILLGIIFFFLVFKPQFEEYIIQKQIEAQQIVVTTMINSLNERGSITIIDAEENQIVLVPMQQEEIK